MANRTQLWYGKTKEGKTTELAEMANLLINEYNYTNIRMISGDGGGWGQFEQYGLINPDNLLDPKYPVQIFDIRKRPYAFAELHWLSEGMWPVMNGAEIYFYNDSKCKTDWKTAKVDGLLVEGTTAISTIWLNHIRGSKNKVGFKASFEYEEEGYEIKGLDQGHYAIVQTELFKLFVQGFHRQPVKLEIVTALLDVATNKKGEEKQYGPKGAGTASTHEIPAWFGEVYHLDKIEVPLEGGGSELRRVTWYLDHYDPVNGLKYPCSNGLIAPLLNNVVKFFPYGYVERSLSGKSGFAQYYKTVEDIKQKYKEYLNKKRNGVEENG